MQYIDWPDHGKCVFMIRVSFSFLPVSLSIKLPLHYHDTSPMTHLFIGASLSELHIDEFAVYICIVRLAVNNFLLVFVLNPK